MKNKLGFMRIVEATIAVLLVISVLLIISGRSISQQQVDFDERAYRLLDEAAHNESLRDLLINDNDGGIATLDAMADENFGDLGVTVFFDICELTTPCENPPFTGDSGDVYVYDRVVSASLDTLGPKRVRMYILV